MKQTILKNGLYSGITIILLFTISFIFLGDLDFTTQEVFGYLSIFVSLLFIFFGIKSHRDKNLGGSISFTKGLGMGMLITLFPSIIFGAFNYVYYIYINPGFAEKYYAASIKTLNETYSGEELATRLTEVEAMREFGSDPILSSFLMFATVIILGFIVSLIASFALRKST